MRNVLKMKGNKMAQPLPVPNTYPEEIELNNKINQASNSAWKTPCVHAMKNYNSMCSKYQAQILELQRQRQRAFSPVSQAVVLFTAIPVAESDIRMVGTIHASGPITPEIYLEQSRKVCAELFLHRDDLVELPNDHWSVVHSHAVVNRWTRYMRTI